MKRVTVFLVLLVLCMFLTAEEKWAPHSEPTKPLDVNYTYPVNNATDVNVELFLTWTPGANSPDAGYNAGYEVFFSGLNYETAEYNYVSNTTTNTQFYRNGLVHHYNYSWYVKPYFVEADNPDAERIYPENFEPTYQYFTTKEIEIDHVIVSAPDANAINVDPEESTMRWTSYTNKDMYNLYYHLKIWDADNNIIYENEEFDNYLFGLSSLDLEYSSQYFFTVKPYYTSTFDDHVNEPTGEAQVNSFYTKAGVQEETPPQNNPVSLMIVDIPEGALPSVPVIPETLPTNLGYQAIAACTYNFEVDGNYQVMIYSDNITLDWYMNSPHVFVDGVEMSVVGKATITNGMWAIMNVYDGANPGSIVVVFDYEGAKGDDIDIVITNNDQTLPVELSSFTAIATSNNFAQISWTTASESHLLGYNLYRSENENQEDALRVTATMIQASNSAMGSSYSFTDDEVEMNVTYNYWLQSNDFDGSSEMFGPVSVKISDQENHDIDNVLLGTQLLGNYPNPFNPETTISYSISQPQHVTIEVYNMRGQLVRTLLNKQVETANAKLNVVWNGKDDDNNDVSSGIYFYKLVTDNYNKTNKMILMK